MALGIGDGGGCDNERNGAFELRPSTRSKQDNSGGNTHRPKGSSFRANVREILNAAQPPWGELNAVNANTGEIVWRKPLGSYDELEAQGLKNAGAPNMGGSIVTAGG